MIDGVTCKSCRIVLPSLALLFVRASNLNDPGQFPVPGPPGEINAVMSARSWGNFAEAPVSRFLSRMISSFKVGADIAEGKAGRLELCERVERGRV